jgi:hypothetical protein
MNRGNTARRRALVPAAGLALVVGCLAGCARLEHFSPPSPPPGTGDGIPAGVTVYRVPPTATAPGLRAPDHPDLVAVDDTVTPNGELFLFLPGTGGQPACCRYLLDTAAQAGFLAIGLTYDNTEAVGRICESNQECYTVVRHDDFDGSAPSSFVDVTPADSIEARLVDMLRYLAARHPSQGWSRYLSGSTPEWSKIVVAGHSQGGGDAAYIAKLQDVEGVMMLSSDVDSTATHPPVAASYLTTGHRTPLDRYIGFAHTRDPSNDKIEADWTALDLQSFGPAVSVDREEPPFRDSHELLTSARVPSGPAPRLAPHDSTAVDSQTPICSNGSPAFVPVWRYMMQVAGGLPVTSGPGLCATG